MTRSIRSALVAITASLLVTLVVQPLPGQSLPSDSAIRAVLQSRIDSGRGAGIIVGIVENGKRRFISAGTAGPGRAKIDEHTIFEIGSITKTFTALLLADAVTRGIVKLEQPVAELLPSGSAVPSRNGRVITLVDLSTHRSGLPRMPSNFNPRDPADPYADYKPEQLYAFLAGYALPRSPGDSGEYSNLGVGLLGQALVEKTKSGSWGALAAQRITTPLGMKETWAEVPQIASSRLAAAYDVNLDTIAPWHFSAVAGAGAIRSTANDMLTYLAAQLDTLHGPLAKAIALQRTPRADFGNNMRIALGWIVRGGIEHPIWWHNGATGGFRSYASFDPKRNAAVIVLTNGATSADDIGAHIIDERVPLRLPPSPPRRETIDVSNATFDRLVGEYALTPAITLSVVRIGDALYAQLTGQQKFRLWPTSRDHYFIKEVPAEVLFALPERGIAASATLRQNGTDQLAARRQP